MFEPYYESWAATMAAKNAYVADLPGWVKNWMWWMRFAFASSIWFLWTRWTARAAFVVGFATLYVAAALAYFVGWGLIWGLVHIVLWTPLMLFLYNKRGTFAWSDGYAIWSRALIATIAVSLVFDIRDVALYLIQ